MVFAERGQTVSVLYYVDGRPRALRGTVQHDAPLRIETQDESSSFFQQPARAIILIQRSNEFAKAEANISSTQINGLWVLQADDFGWEKVDRRRYLRVPMQIRMNVRTVLETNEGVMLQSVDCQTQDLSIGGAWVRSGVTLEPGSLVECTGMAPSQGEFRAFGVVRWADSGEKDGFGVEFLDLIGASRRILHNFLAEAA